MNVLLSSCTHWWNAEAAYAATLGEVLQGAGHRVWVLTQPGTRNEAHLRARGLEVLTAFPVWEANPWRLLRAVSDLKTFQARNGVQVVNVFRAREFPAHMLAARGAHAPRLIRTRGSARPTRGHWLNRRLYGRWCDGLIASAEVVRHQMTQALRLSPDRIRTLYYPIDLPHLPQPARRDADRRQLLAELDLPAQSLLLGMVGRIAPEKGHEPLLEALGSLIRDFPSLVLLVLVKGYPGEETGKARLVERAQALGVSEHVRWMGYREDVRQLMALMDIGVIPSLASETNCRVAVEFFSVGTPVAAFPTGALPEVVENGISGLVARDHTPPALVEVLTRLLADAGLRARLGQGARQQAEGRFSRERFLAGTLAVFEQALSGS